MTAAVRFAMADPARQELRGDPAYPTGDGRPMAETDWHRDLMADLIAALSGWYSGQQVYVSGNLLLFYEPGNKRRHVSPDVLVTKGIDPGKRLNYILWQEGKPPDVVIELTSKSTRHEDLKHKFLIYQDKIRVPEYFLFDPLGHYLQPRVQGYRLQRGKYSVIRPVRGRMVSKELGLVLEPEATSLRLIDDSTGEPLLFPREQAQRAREQAERAREQAERAREQAERAREQTERAREQTEAAREQAKAERVGRAKAEEELVRLRQELARLRNK